MERLQLELRSEIPRCLPENAAQNNEAYVRLVSENDGRNNVCFEELLNHTQTLDAKEKRIEDLEVQYKVDDVPPWYLAIILGLQHYLTMFGGTVSYPYILTPKLCMRDDDPARGYVVSTIFFVSGIVTFLQSTFGVRLPIIQGSSFSFLVPSLAILSLPEWRCPTEAEMMAAKGNGSMVALTEDDWQELWQVRMREIQGAIIVSSLFEVVIGLTGLIGFLLRFITPISVTPIIVLIGLSLFEEVAATASKHWGISLLTSVLLILFSQYLSDVKVPFLTYNRKKGCHKTKFLLFKLFPVLLTIATSWLLCAVLTVTNVFEPGHPVRTDSNLAALHSSAWFRIPYPGQWGLPTVGVAAVFGIFAGVLSSTIESVGDYYACARMAGAPPPPPQAINRGIFMEGFGCVLAGIWGTGTGLTSYSENIGAIGVTKVGSRRVIQFGAGVMILFGLLGKFGAVFMTIPEPIIGGVFFVMFAIITGVGLTNLQFINLNSSRNLFIIGVSIFVGICLPNWMKTNADVIQTGSTIANQILSILVRTSLFIGGALAIFLDNTIPGSADDKGVQKWRTHGCPEGTNLTEEENSQLNKCYDLPFGNDFVRRHKFFQHFPISPTYNSKFSLFKPCSCAKDNKTHAENHETQF